MVVIEYDGNVVQSEFEYSNKRFNDRSDMFALGGNRIAMIDASIPDNIGFQTSKYELTFNILDLTAEEVIKRTDIAELDPDGYVNGIWTSPMTSHSRFQDMHFNLAKASDGFFVTFSNSSGLFIAKVDENGDLTRSPTPLSLDGLPVDDYRSLDVVELTPEVLVANFSHSASGAQSVIKLYDSRSLEPITSNGEAISLIVDASANHTPDGKMIFDGENQLTVFTQPRVGNTPQETTVSRINVNLPHDPAADLSRLGFRQTKSDRVSDGYTMVGEPLTAAGAAASWARVILPSMVWRFLTPTLAQAASTKSLHC